MMTNSERPLLALDFGGTKLAAGVVVLGEESWQSRAQAASPSEPNAQQDLQTITSLGSDLLGDATPAAVGISFGGPVRVSEGRVLLSHHVPDWENFPLRERLEEEFGAPAVVDNDANVGALGEWRFGAGRGCESLLYVTVSTGVGGGWVFDGQIYHGADSLAGEIGHMTIEPGGPVCTCGRRGCVEAMAAGPAIARQAREALGEHIRTAMPSDEGQTLRELVAGDLEAITAKDVSQAAKAGDDLAQRVLDEAAEALGYGIGCAIALMNPERVIVGGGVAKAGRRYLETVRSAARANAPEGARGDVVPAALSDDAPLWGAVALAEKLLDPRSFGNP